MIYEIVYGFSWYVLIDFRLLGGVFMYCFSIYVTSLHGVLWSIIMFMKSVKVCRFPTILCLLFLLPFDWPVLTEIFLRILILRRFPKIKILRKIVVKFFS